MNLKHSVFGPPQVLSGKIADCMATRKSGYFQPISDNFASLNSIIYQPNDPLIGIQVTNAAIKTKGLKALQSLLQNDLSHLRPTSTNPWIILFVVPTSMEKSFTRQNITGDASTTWSKKTVQYVLGLDEHEAFKFHAQFEDEQDESENE